MSIDSNHELMKDSFLESKDVINKIFDKINAPEEWRIKHMTFDELLVALYRLLGYFEGNFLDEVTVTPETMLDGITAYNHYLEKITGIIPSIDGAIHVPTTEDKLIVNANVYCSGEHIMLGDANLIPGNIRKDITIFNVKGTYDGGGSDFPIVPRATAGSKDIIKSLFAYENDLSKIVGTLNDYSGKTRNGEIAGIEKKNNNENNHDYYLYVNPVERGVFNNESKLRINIKIDPSKILLGYKIFGIEGTHVCECPIPIPTMTPTIIDPTDPTALPTPTITPTVTFEDPTEEPTIEPPTVTEEPTIEPPTVTEEPTIEPPTEPTIEPPTVTDEPTIPIPTNPTITEPPTNTEEPSEESSTPPAPTVERNNLGKYTYICIDPDLLQNQVETRTHTFSSVVEQYLDEKWHNEDPTKDRTLIDAGHTYLDQRPLNTLYYYRITAKKVGNIVHVGFSDFQDDLNSAHTFKSYRYQFDLTDEKLYDSFTDKFRIGIQVDNLESARFKIDYKIHRKAPEDDNNGEYTDGSFGEHVSIVCGEHFPYSKSQSSMHDGIRLRCPIETTDGTRDEIEEGDIHHKIQVDLAIQFVDSAELQGYDKVTIYTSNNTCRLWDDETWSTYKTFDVTDEEGIINYLKEIKLELNDENDGIPWTDQDDDGREFLIVKGKIAHGQRWREWQADVSDWNACPMGYVKWTTYPDRIDQTEGHNELNYYVSEFLPFEYDWEFNATVYDIHVEMMNVNNKLEMKYGQGRAGLIITTLSGGPYGEFDPQDYPDDVDSNTKFDIPDVPASTYDLPDEDEDDGDHDDTNGGEYDPPGGDNDPPEGDSDPPDSDDDGGDDDDDDDDDNPTPLPSDEDPTPSPYYGPPHEEERHYWPTPVLQWKYSDYLAPRYYPFVRYPYPEKYGRPYPIIKTIPWQDVSDLKSADPEWVQIIDLGGVTPSVARTKVPSGWTLVAIKSPKDQSIVEQLLRTQTGSTYGNFLIGLSGQKTTKAGGDEEWHYTWGFGDNVSSKYKNNQRYTTDETGFSNWAPHEPNEPRARDVEIFANDHKWGDHGSDEAAFGKWNDQTDLVQGIIVEKIGNASRERITRYVQEFVGWQEYIESRELTAMIWVFGRLCWEQEYRSKLYHYGHNGYVNMTYLSNDLYNNINVIVGYYEKYQYRQTKFLTEGWKFQEKYWSPYFRTVPSETYDPSWQGPMEKEYVDYWPSIMEYKAMWGSINLK